MPNDPLVSIVMPVFNSEEYLSHAVESVLGQSYANIELILVDDGSTDASGVLCDRFSEHDARVVAVHKRNGGICSARNAGIDAARGTYVAFCDNDDEYLPGLIEDNVRIAEDVGSDEVRFLREHLIVLDGEVIRREVLGEGKPSLNVTNSTLCDAYYDFLSCGQGVWTGLYRRSMLNRHSVRFPEHMKFGYEDLFFNLLVLRATSHIAMNPKVYYRWIERYVHSTSRKFSTNRLDSIRDCLRLESEVGEQYGIRMHDEQKWAAHIVDTYVVRMLQQLTLPMCDLPAKERCRQLAALSSEPALHYALLQLPLLQGSCGAKTRLVALLLRRKRYGLLLRMFAANAHRTGRVY